MGWESDADRARRFQETAEVFRLALQIADRRRAELRRLAKDAHWIASSPDYDEQATQDALWRLVNTVLEPANSHVATPEEAADLAGYIASRAAERDDRAFILGDGKPGDGKNLEGAGNTVARAEIEKARSEHRRFVLHILTIVGEQPGIEQFLDTEFAVKMVRDSAIEALARLDAEANR